MIWTLQYLSKVEGVKRARLRLLEGHDLDEEGPGREVSIGDGVEQVPDGVVRVGGGKAVGLLHRQVLDALVSLKSRGHVMQQSNTDSHNMQGSGVKHRGTDLVVELAVDWLAVAVEQLEGVRAVAVHVAVAVRETAVTEQEGHLQEEETGNKVINSWKLFQ